MHITEGIITGGAAIGYTGLGASLMAWGTARMKSFAKQAPENKPLLHSPHEGVKTQNSLSEPGFLLINLQKRTNFNLVTADVLTARG